MDKHLYQLSRSTVITIYIYMLVFRPSLQTYNIRSGVSRTLSNIQNAAFVGKASGLNPLTIFVKTSI